MKIRPRKRDEPLPRYEEMKTILNETILLHVHVRLKRLLGIESRWNSAFIIQIQNIGCQNFDD